MCLYWLANCRGKRLFLWKYSRFLEMTERSVIFRMKASVELPADLQTKIRSLTSRRLTCSPFYICL